MPQVRYIVANADTLVSEAGTRRLMMEYEMALSRIGMETDDK